MATWHLNLKGGGLIPYDQCHRHAGIGIPIGVVSDGSDLSSAIGNSSAYLPNKPPSAGCEVKISGSTR